jgi:hypothetical protein
MMMMPMPVMVAAPVVQHNEGDCPQCKKGNLAFDKKCSCWTCFVCVMFAPALFCDCAWSKKRRCLSCGYSIEI